MPRRQRKRRLLTFVGLLVGTIALASFLFTLVYEVAYFDSRWGIVLCGGSVNLHLAPFPSWFPSGWVAKRAESSFALLPHMSRNASAGCFFIVPLWTVVVSAAAGLVLARRFYSPVPPGHCEECRYNLTGNLSGWCPECGTPIMPIQAIS